MTSTMGCVGLAAADEDELAGMLERMLPEAAVVGTAGDLQHHRWTDPSGARLTMVVRDEELVYLLPSFAGRPGVRLAGLVALSADVAAADVLDGAGEQTTRLACELEQHRFLARGPVEGLAAVTAFGQDVQVHPDEAAYDASDDSLLTPGSRDEPPPESLADGVRWPPRMAAESFISFGLFGDPGDSEPYARMAGTVLEAATHTVATTGQRFHVARTSLLGMELDVCLAAADHPAPPPVGGVVTGTVYLVASLDALWSTTPPPPARRGWFRRRR